jgi:hypothetical protein
MLILLIMFAALIGFFTIRHYGELLRQIPNSNEDFQIFLADEEESQPIPSIETQQIHHAISTPAARSA